MEWNCVWPFGSCHCPLTIDIENQHRSQHRVIVVKVKKSIVRSQESGARTFGLLTTVSYLIIDSIQSSQNQNQNHVKTRQDGIYSSVVAVTVAVVCFGLIVWQLVFYWHWTDWLDWYIGTSSYFSIHISGQWFAVIEIAIWNLSMSNVTDSLSETDWPTLIFTLQTDVSVSETNEWLTSESCYNDNWQQRLCNSQVHGAIGSILVWKVLPQTKLLVKNLNLLPGGSGSAWFWNVWLVWFGIGLVTGVSTITESVKSLS